MVFVCHVRRRVAKIDWVRPCKIGLALRHVFFGGEGKNKNRFTKWIFVLEHGDDTWSLNWWHSSLTSPYSVGESQVTPSFVTIASWMISRNRTKSDV